MFDAAPGANHAVATGGQVAFYAALFAQRVRRTQLGEKHPVGTVGWMPRCAAGGAKGIPAAERQYLLLTADALTAHLSGEMEIGRIRCRRRRCWWLAADFDGPV
jgi:hypothetical protein